ncbi:hypothetical protein [Desulfonema magnum]|uniref:hypothetical protein n=1 Tax=Desulfonema magnum TaxID=45655 RepID=UPI001A9BDF50|nr:hypothetical protein [Desulfonema magnum]
MTAGDPLQFRLRIDEMIAAHPELFPPGAERGWRTKDSYISKKQGIKIRRIEIGGVSHTVRPSFVMPYTTDMTDDAENALFLRKFDVPFWAIARIFGKNPMHWQRTEQSLGRNSIVGTTVRNPENLPKHIVADEKHTSLGGGKAYVATTVAEECFLGASVTEDAGEESLGQAYGKYREEARNADPDYAPETVNTDGWKATRNARKKLFPSATLILCFLHTFIGIRNCTKKSSEKFMTKSSESCGTAIMLRTDPLFRRESDDSPNGRRKSPSLPQSPKKSPKCGKISLTSPLHMIFRGRTERAICPNA